MKLIFLSFCSLISTIIYSVRGLIWRLHLKKIHRIRVFENKKFYFHHYGDIAKILFCKEHMVRFSKGFEYSTLKLFLDNIKNDNMVILDIGANVGLFSLLAADKLGNNGKIYAFEPCEKTFNILKLNLEANNCRDVFPFKLALSNENASCCLAQPSGGKNNNNDAFNYISSKTDNASGEIVRTQTLDSFVAEHSVERVDLIKIDIEGAELLCFQGAKNTIANYKPVIIFECLESFCERFDYNMSDILLFLKAYNYKLFQYDVNQWIATPE